MSRALWFVAGAGAGIYAVLRAKRAAELFTADGLRDRAQAAALGLNMLRGEFAQGRADREAELRERFLPAPGGAPRLPPSETPQDETSHGETPRGETPEGTESPESMEGSI